MKTEDHLDFCRSHSLFRVPQPQVLPVLVKKAVRTLLINNSDDEIVTKLDPVEGDVALSLEDSHQRTASIKSHWLPHHSPSFEVFN
jgi:hypothetical protein